MWTFFSSRKNTTVSKKNTHAILFFPKWNLPHLVVTSLNVKIVVSILKESVNTHIWLWHFFCDRAMFWKCWTLHGNCSVTSDPTCWRLTTFLHPWQPNWSVSVPVTGSSHDNDQLSQCPGPLHVPPLFFCSFLTRNLSWPHLRTAETVLLAHIKASLIPDLQCQSPYSFCLLHNQSRSPSHSSASNRKPAISNLTHFSNC